ncbi:glycosyltransferase family 39 protein [bacterium]|nr:glycosyltransferase family 39 protein [bacterium]
MFESPRRHREQGLKAAKPNTLDLVDYIFLVACLILGFYLRFSFLRQTNAVIDADEAIVGLMAKHIAAGFPVPIFYYGQAYMGSLEAILVAGVFYIFGPSSLGLKLVPLLFSMIFILCVYFLGRYLFDRTAGRFAALFAAVPPHGLLVWSTKARGGFIEVVVLGTICLILGLKILKYYKFNIRSFSLLGLILGLAWWVNNQSIYYCFALGLTLGLYALIRLGLLRSLTLLTVTLSSFLLGGAAFWYANLSWRPKFQSFFIFEHSNPSDLVKNIHGFFAQGLPMILGARRFWNTTAVFPYAEVIAYSCFTVIMIVAVSLAVLRREHRGGIILLLVFTCSIPLIFATSQFGWLSQEPRYLLPLYSSYFPLIGLSLSFLRSRTEELGAIAEAAVYILFSALLSLHLASLYHGEITPGEPFIFKGERVAKDQSQLYDWLEQNNYRHIKTNYWIGYRTAFETNEAITFSRYKGPQSLRIPDYERDIRRREYAPLVLVPTQANLLSKGLSDQGFRFRTTPVGSYVVIDQISPISGEQKLVPLQAEELATTHNQEERALLVDGKEDQRWGTKHVQEPGMRIDVNFSKPRIISGLNLDLGAWKHDYPRELVIYGISPDGSSCKLIDTRGNTALHYALEEERTLEFYFPKLSVKGLSISQEGQTPQMDWSLAELKVFEPENDK